MKLTVNAFVTQDGVMQGPGGADEDTDGGFANGGWVAPHFDEEFGAIVDSWFTEAEAFLLGRRTFEIFRSYWPNVTDPEDRVAAKLNSLPKYVVSSSLEDPEWGDTTVLRSLDDVRDLKERAGGEVQVHGSATFAASLHAAGLVDEYRLLTFPVAVGDGKRLFTGDAPARGFEVLETRTTGTGVVYARLAPAEFRTAGHEVVDGKDTVV